jgi:hypothetical protein
MLHIYTGICDVTRNLKNILHFGVNLGGVWVEVLKFNKHCSIFVLFDKKFPIWD